MQNQQLNFDLRAGWPAPDSGFAESGSVNVLDIANGTWVTVPVRAAVGSWPVHYCSAHGAFDVGRAAETLRAQLLRSSCSVGETAEGDPGGWGAVSAQLGERLYASVDSTKIGVWAATPEQAREVAERLRRAFLRKDPPAHAAFWILKYACGDIEAEAVRLGAPDPGSPDPVGLDLLYGDGFEEWADGFARTLADRSTGLSIFTGPPGTGKTSFLRHVMARLKDTHRFYFIGSANLRMLRDAEFVDFWSNERRSHSGSKMAVILEDAENALMARCSDNRQEVSLLLNITDGILGEFLRLQVICTINCALHDLDPALLRPGRLTAHRYFGKLGRETAERLAARIGRTLPAGDGPFSLAEVFSGALDASAAREPRVGFAP